MSEFPTDDVTLGMLEAACIGDDEGTHLMDMLGFGSVDTGTYEHHDPETGDTFQFETRAGGFHPNDVILALIDEVRQLRRSHPDIHTAGCSALDWRGTCSDWLTRNADIPPRRYARRRAVGVLADRVRTMLGRRGDGGLDSGQRITPPPAAANGSHSASGGGS